MSFLLTAIFAGLSAFNSDARFPAVSTDQAWALLPRENPPLPAWARVLVKPLPRTTGAMLELDRLHRADNPLGPVLAARLRWLAADALGCDYARASAHADLKRYGASAGEIQRLVDDKPLPDEIPLNRFARMITKAAYTVTDAQFAEVLKQYGPEKMTAIVHTLAFANFHDRIIMAIGVKAEAEGSPPPLSINLDSNQRAKVATPARPSWDRVTDAKPAKRYDAPDDWKDLTFADLEKNLAAQKARSPRVPLPDESHFSELNADTKHQADTINWTKICAGYQPIMTQSWFLCLREFQQEARLNRLFASSLFWVVTRTNDCFY
jgi:alkylhydroperoxidase family enzyme